ncbi:hypothetical protein MRX96_019507 [Rhipicephalus microplus]
MGEARFKRPAPPVAAELLRNPAANVRRPMRKGRSGTVGGRLIRSLPPARPAQPPLKVSGVPLPPHRMLRHNAEHGPRVTSVCPTQCSLKRRSRMWAEMLRALSHAGGHCSSNVDGSTSVDKRGGKQHFPTFAERFEASGANRKAEKYRVTSVSDPHDVIEL